ncbi:MAG TPA: type II toxin-antitoxin system HicA family toxin [Dehalococcoidia bacterium]|nr:type II toxin-antitoxin system HicA family toxin [Dehalococcoidia bacterium]
MPKLLSARRVLRALGRAGFEVVSQRGSHIKLKKPVEGGELVVILPGHRELAEGTLASVLRQARLSREELERLL